LNLNKQITVDDFSPGKRSSTKVTIPDIESKIKKIGD